MRIPDQIILSNMADPVPFTESIPLGNDVIEETCLVDWAQYDPARARFGFETRIPISGGRHRSFSCWGWSLIFIWYGGW